jgi:regulator of cell morphogenesis and NO signaling
MGVDPAWTVNEVLRRYPAAVAVFNAFGVDACCGGANGVPEAAREAGLDPADLLAALESAVCPADAGAPAGR